MSLVLSDFLRNMKHTSPTITNLQLLAENYRRRASEAELYPSDKDDSTGSRVHFDVLDYTQRMEIRSSRKLTTSEAETVFVMMKAQLNITNDEDDADADTLLMYALDIVDEGQSVEKVIEEVRRTLVYYCF